MDASILEYKKQTKTNIKSIVLTELLGPITFGDKSFYKSKRDYIRVVCLSDTHSQTEKIIENIPDADILIHSGDITKTGLLTEVEKFKDFLHSLTHTYKVFIAGNHDTCFDKERFEFMKKKLKHDIPNESFEKLKSSITEKKNVIYLEESSINLLGYEIYGSPYTPKFFNGAFMKDEEFLKPHWQKIPENVDILITHGPPKYIGDFTTQGINAGSQSLYDEVKLKIKPKFHIFGHIHEARGTYIDEDIPGTTFINCCSLDRRYKVNQDPCIVFDLPKKLSDD